ncbi:LPXTG cell wall anchor domain-containing protein [Corynebacterium renale]|uniref:LPXTG-motif cell wall-anchored protein n=1 Tax=Corynebacterium renale TaxID=1724 RepID=A0A2A9DM25_9CORY|nr:LPXTG cell wall anchor domain-containing protein [Corynebacterium renale]PFG27797.1 LPXTG-motif cell wall-anchored protein [Corynebacterium renale]SQI22084.1 Uncharacterised protein [Corynebacterium renale]
MLGAIAATSRKPTNWKLKGNAQLDAGEYAIVANIRKCELPKTGGIDVWTQAALSLLIIGGGIFLARRKA